LTLRTLENGDKVKVIENAKDVFTFVNFCGGSGTPQQDNIEYKRRIEVLKNCFAQFERADIKRRETTFVDSYISLSGITYKFEVPCEIYPDDQTSIDVDIIFHAINILLLKVQSVELTRPDELAIIISNLEGKELTPEQIELEVNKWYRLIQIREEGEEIPDVYNIFVEADVLSLDRVIQKEINKQDEIDFAFMDEDMGGLRIPTRVEPISIQKY